jgi:hypothetical protein
MDVDSSQSSTQLPATGSTSVSTLPLRSSPRKSPILPKKSTKSKRGSPKSIVTNTAVARDVPTSKSSVSRSQRYVSTAPKSLLPANERKPLDDRNLALAGKDAVADADKPDIAADGGSAGREGRQFTVSNVGNNGRIYLR